MSSLSSNLKTLMELAKINASELARRTGIAQPIIHRLSTGQNKNPKLATVKPISEYFMVTVSQLIGEEALPPMEHGFYRVSSEDHAINRLPLLTWQESIQGSGAILDKSAQAKTVFINSDAKVSKTAYALKVEDHSMEPVFPIGTVIIVDPERTAKHHDFALVHLHQNAGVCLRQIVIENQHTYAHALNPASPTDKQLLLQPQDRLLGVMAQAKVNF